MAVVQEDRKWIDRRNGLYVISGPCSAESELQVLRTARRLQLIPQVKIFRCGLWKPRTLPGDFEGVGKEGFPWLRKVKEITGLPLLVEVATPAHIEACLKAGVDMMWVGSRTVGNPFSMAEISSALQGARIPVFVKNPVSPDLKLWIGALERLKNSGIQKLAAVHRGFSSLHSYPYRNVPYWKIPVSLMDIYPDLPVLVDPSHICGSRPLLPFISQMALDLGFDGLMIESHYRPGSALTDREQQITPGNLKFLLEGLILHRKDDRIPGEIARLRKLIDEADRVLIEAVANRLGLMKEMGMQKKDNKMPVIDLTRWKKLLSERIAEGKKLGIDPHFLENLLDVIHQESQRLQAPKDQDS